MLKSIFLLLLVLVSPLVLAHGMSAADQARILNASYWEYMQLGATHMLSGYDHLLFLFGVIFFLTRFKDIVKLITAFTIGHSITLIFATLLEIKANYYLIDAVIALTVCYKAFDNLDGFKKYLQMSAPNLTWMVFAFGLIHGFGLSTRLQQLPLGEQGLVMKIISFNVGVEFGQILALSIMLALLLGWRKTESFKRFSQVSNLALMFAGALLLIMQLHSYQHTQYPDAFPLNTDDHYHIHKDINEETSPKPNYPMPFNFDALPAQSFKPAEKSKPAEKPKPAEQHSHDGEHFHNHD